MFKIFLVLAVFSQVEARYESVCETIPSKIHLTKEEYSKSKELMRTCEEDVQINKCEGTCASGTQPSAMDRSGFTKDCKCCREGGYRERIITLTKCFDQDGLTLDGSLATMQVTLKEPEGCQCFPCGSELPSS
ncbi:partner of bursicon [Eurytemora carolleeae]|uniref:partner of bursicon n=1 Tax=Eurytemora carolleeae TaxID=1294199 RepID=UPI000C788E2B|nr:partner of bursicon [Eurytemora carolleeae]XP_023325679.1 partner of bursicon [Eurytemora carolleeae]|eukprot:XP_023325678.1 partner of bursicon-like [Eurytemora affinis]